MIYTAREGVNTRHEKTQSLMLKGLAIAFASSIAIFGAFAQNNDNRTEANNQEPLAIYTTAPTDFGDASNPQGNGGSTQSTSGDTTGTGLGSSGSTAAQQQARLAAAGSTSSGTQPTSSSLPVGGMGGESPEEDNSCLCQQLQSTVSTQVSTVTAPLPPLPPALP